MFLPGVGFEPTSTKANDLKSFELTRFPHPGLLIASFILVK